MSPPTLCSLCLPQGWPGPCSEASITKANVPPTASAHCPRDLQQISFPGREAATQRGTLLPSQTPSRGPSYSGGWCIRNTDLGQDCLLSLLSSLPSPTVPLRAWIWCWALADSCSQAPLWRAPVLSVDMGPVSRLPPPPASHTPARLCDFWVKRAPGVLACRGVMVCHHAGFLPPHLLLLTLPPTF